LLVDVFEHPSPERAHLALLEFTGQFHRPTDLSVRTDDVGEVSIATPDGAWFAFARGNLVVRVVSTDGVPNSARTVAQLIDGDLMAKPEAEIVSTSDLSTLLVEERPTPRAAPPGHAMFALEEAEEDPAVAEENKPTIKVFSKGGRVIVEHDSLIVPASPDVEVEVFTSEPGGGWTGKRYRPPEPA
jgi:hypothetical protein